MAKMARVARQLTPDDWASLRADVTEAFSPGSPVQERDLFSGRGSQIASLEDAVNQRGKHGIVFGERGVGKTSLANVLSRSLGDKEMARAHYLKVLELDPKHPSASQIRYWLAENAP